MTRWVFLIIIILGLVMYSSSINSVQAVELEVRNKEGGLVSSTGDTSLNRNSFEFGQFAIPIFITYSILFILAVLYYKKRVPTILKKTVSKVLDFDVSRKVSLLIVSSLLIIFIVFAIDKTEHPDEISWGDYTPVSNFIKNYSFGSILNTLLSFRYILHLISLNIFGNIRIIAIVESISLLVLVYLFTVKITKKRFTGIISIVVLLQSSLFLRYSTTITYDNLWVIFYILSLYLVYKKWFLSPISYIFSIFSKPISALFIPLTLFFIYRADTKESKKKLIISYLIMTGLVFTYVFQIYRLGTINSFYVNEFFTGFHSVGLFLRNDGFVTLFLLPVVVGLFILSRKGFKQADSLMVLINGILWFEPLLGGFTELTNQPYRIIPLVVFFAISVGVLFSNRKIQQISSKNYVSNIMFVSAIMIIIINLALVIFPALFTGSYRVALD